MPESPLTILPDGACIAAASDTRLRVMGDLRVLGSLSRVELDAAGSVDCGGALAGGSFICGGGLRCGSAGGTDARGEFWIGAPTHEARHLLEQTWSLDASLAKELREPGGVAATRREEIRLKRHGLAWRLQRLSEACGRHRLRVETRLHPGVRVRLGVRSQRCTFLRSVEGPLEIAANDRGEPELIRSNEVTPLLHESGWIRR